MPVTTKKNGSSSHDRRYQPAWKRRERHRRDGAGKHDHHEGDRVSVSHDVVLLSLGAPDPQALRVPADADSRRISLESLATPYNRHFHPRAMIPPWTAN